MAAWKFDLGVMQWEHPEKMEKPLSVRVISDDRMKRDHGAGTRAWTQSTGVRFDIRLSLVGDPGMDVTIAHELGHVQAFRVLGKILRAELFTKGHGLMMNLLYADHLGLEHHKLLADQARTFRSFTAEEARAILTNEEYVDAGTDQEKGKRIFRIADGIVLRRVPPDPQGPARCGADDGARL